MSDPSMRSQSVKADSDTRVGQIVQRVVDEQCAYVGIYKPGELGRGTWRAVLPTHKRRGRGHKGEWESVVLSTFGREGIDNLVERLKDIPEAVGVRHILNPHCNQDEGVRIVWPTDAEGQREMEDWARRDEMRREGKTVRPRVSSEAQACAEEESMMPQMGEAGWPMAVGVKMPMSTWNNTVWTSLG